MKNYTLIYFLMLHIFVISAQKERLSLEDCLAIGMKNNINLKIEKLNVKQSKKQKSSFLNSLLPRVNLYGRHQYNFGSTIDPTTNFRVSQNFLQDNINLNASSDIINFNNIYISKKSKLNLEKAKVNREMVVYDYKLGIIENFFSTMFTQELLKIQQKQLKNTGDNLNRIKEEVTIGSKPQSDLYDITLNFSQEEKNVLKIQQQLKVQLQELANLLNKDDDFSQRELIYLGGTIDNTNPKIRFAELEKNISKTEYKLSKSKLLPVISMFYNMSSFYFEPLNQVGVTSNFKTQLENNKNQQVGLQLSLTLFDGFRRSKNIVGAKIEQEKKDLVFQNTKKSIAQKLKVEKLKEQQLIELNKQLTTVYENIQRSFKTSQAKFENGKIELQVFNLTKNQLLTSEYDLLKNRLELEWLRVRMCK